MNIVFSYNLVGKKIVQLLKIISLIRILRQKFSLSCKPMTGWTSWYNYYQNINEDIILENLNNYKALEQKIEIFQIDDGYQTAVGDWLSIDGAKFPRGMKYIADSIKACGFKAGIWLAPFVCETNSEIFKEKKHWILKDEKGEMVFGGSNWSKFYTLDIYNKEVRDKLILGCGVPLGPAFGKVDYCRIGCDVGLDWNDKPYFYFRQY